MESIVNLSEFKIKKGDKMVKSTHTRMGDDALEIYGGNFHIPDDKWDLFMTKYYNQIISGHGVDYLTEVQLDNGTLVTDIDLRYASTIKSKQHTEDHIIDIIMGQMECISELVVIPENTVLEVWVMEKDEVNITDSNQTKDGIHIVVSINLSTNQRIIFRELFTKTIKNLWSDLPLTCTWDNVVDDGVAKGKVNWMIFGSQKPGYDVYKQKYKFVCSFSNNEWEIKEVEKVLTLEEFKKISVRYPSHLIFEPKPTSLIEQPKKKSATTKTEQTTNPQNTYALKMDNEPISESELRNRLDLITVEHWDNMLSWRQLIMGIGSTLDNQERSFIVASEYSKKSRKYDADADEKINQLLTQKAYGYGTINYYAKISNPVAYKTLVSKSDRVNIYDQSDYGRAKLYLTLVGDDFQYQDKMPYIYNGRLWRVDNDKEQRALSKHIQIVLIDFYGYKLKELKPLWDEMQKTGNPNSSEYQELCANFKSLSEQMLKVKSSTSLNLLRSQVLTHAEESNIRFDMIRPNYFVFKNTAFNFQNGEEVKISKYDYITQFADYNYIKPEQVDIDEIKQVLASILPNEEILLSFLSCLRSACIGKRIQKFIMMTGKGRNGKGLINQLMKFMLGSYFYQGSISTITTAEKTKGANPEIANMDKKRAVVFGEPEDNQQLMLGVIKALTGEDTINARQLYMGNTVTNLLMTLFLEVNGKPNVCGKIGDSIKERFIKYNFPNLFTDDATLINDINIFKQNKLYESSEWRERIRHALFHVLLNLCDENGKIMNDIFIPKIVKDETIEYLESKDEISNWVNEEYIFVDDTTFKNDINAHHITMKDLYAHFKCSAVYCESSKYAKRVRYAKKSFEEEVKENIKLKPYYMKRFTNQVNKERINIDNVFIRMRSKTTAEIADDKGEEIEYDHS